MGYCLKGSRFLVFHFCWDEESEWILWAFISLFRAQLAGVEGG